jgi:hypothetical protein
MGAHGSEADPSRSARSGRPNCAPRSARCRAPRYSTNSGAKIAAAQAKVDAAAASTDQAKEGLALAKLFLRRAGAAYREADGVTQRAWNQALFQRLIIAPVDDELQVVGAELTETFADLLSEQLVESLDALMKAPAAVFAAGGSNVEQIVTHGEQGQTLMPGSRPCSGHWAPGWNRAVKARLERWQSNPRMEAAWMPFSPRPARMARPERLELPTFWSEARRSIH